MVSNRKKINRILSKVMMGIGILFLLYVGYMYYSFYFGSWQNRVENVK